MAGVAEPSALDLHSQWPPLEVSEASPCGSLVLSHSTRTSGSPTLSSHSTGRASVRTSAPAQLTLPACSVPFAQERQQEGRLARVVVPWTRGSDRSRSSFDVNWLQIISPLQSPDEGVGQAVRTAPGT